VSEREANLVREHDTRDLNAIFAALSTKFPTEVVEQGRRALAL